MIENIDIGGPTLIRAAAKNHPFTAVVVSPESYDAVLEELRQNGRQAVGPHPREPGARGLRADGALRHGDLALVRRARGGLPGAVHALVREGARPAVRREPAPAGRVLRRGRRAYAPDVDGVEAARQGADVQQPARSRAGAAADRRVRAAGRGDHQAQQPVRGGIAAEVGEAFDKALATDPQSAYGGIYCLNRRVDRALAEKLHAQFVELVFAPGYDADALEVLQQKPNVRLLENQERRRDAGDRARRQAGARRDARPGPRHGARSARGMDVVTGASRPRRSGASCCSRCACASTCARTRSCLRRGSARSGSAPGR